MSSFALASLEQARLLHLLWWQGHHCPSECRRKCGTAAVLASSAELLWPFGQARALRFKHPRLTAFSKQSLTCSAGFPCAASSVPPRIFPRIKPKATSSSRISRKQSQRRSCPASTSLQASSLEKISCHARLALVTQSCLACPGHSVAQKHRAVSVGRLCEEPGSTFLRVPALFADAGTASVQIE